MAVIRSVRQQRRTASDARRHDHDSRRRCGGGRSLAGLLTALLLTVPAVAAASMRQQPHLPPAVTDSARPQELVPGVTDRGDDSVSIRLVDVELRVAVQALGRYVDYPVLFGASTPARVTLETPRPVPRRDVVRLLRGLVESQNLTFVTDTVAGLYRVHGPDVPGGMGMPPGMSGSTGHPAMELFALRLRHARAADVAATVNALYGRAGALGELGTGARAAGSTLGQQLGQGMVPFQPPVVPGAPQPQSMAPSAGMPLPGLPPGVAPPDASGATSALSGGRFAQLSGEVTIVPNANSNALLIRSSRADFELIQAAVEQLDVRPLQVLIEVVVAEVRRDRSFSFGVEVSAPEQGVPGVSHVRASASQQGIALGDFALRVMPLGPGPDFEAVLRASAARGDARILSRPIVLATNGEAAEILVGSQRPFIQVQRSLPTDAPSRDQVVQYKDVGTRLSVRPVISGDGYVSLAVTQEVNAATAETQFDAPVISTRTVQTVLLVRDSQAIVLGGLTDEQREASQGGIPVLSRIPLLGGLFGRASRHRTETEFFLFLRPRIIRTDADAEGVTEPYRQRAGAGVP